MRTLQEIDNSIEAAARQRAMELAAGPTGKCLTEVEIYMMQRNARVSEKTREMYSILQVLEEYLKYNSLDGKAERHPLRKKLKEMLASL